MILSWCSSSVTSELLLGRLCPQLEVGADFRPQERLVESGAPRNPLSPRTLEGPQVRPLVSTAPGALLRRENGHAQKSEIIFPLIFGFLPAVEDAFDETQKLPRAEPPGPRHVPRSGSSMATQSPLEALWCLPF